MFPRELFELFRIITQSGSVPLEELDATFSRRLKEKQRGMDEAGVGGEIKSVRLPFFLSFTSVWQPTLFTHGELSRSAAPD